MSIRKAQIRTKIQLGGLVIKAGLLDPLNLHLGDDLQKDEQNFEAVATLLGAFCDLSEPLQNDEAQKILWRERGKKALANI
ncbi:MAG: conjugal transfer protein TraD [Alphaproteobacteria bacterium]|nr:conjugal transfer protein TraD [Alphaproteobacteria bacterium]